MEKFREQYLKIRKESPNDLFINQILAKNISGVEAFIFTYLVENEINSGKFNEFNQFSSKYMLKNLNICPSWQTRYLNKLKNRGFIDITIDSTKLRFVKINWGVFEQSFQKWNKYEIDDLNLNLE